METGRTTRAEKTCENRKEKENSSSNISQLHGQAQNQQPEEKSLRQPSGGRGNGHEYRGNKQRRQETTTTPKETIISIAYFNARSIQKKLSDLEIFACEKNPDVILICESWCNKTIANSTLQLSNYTLKSRLDRLDTVNGIGGGLLK